MKGTEKIYEAIRIAKNSNNTMIVDILTEFININTVPAKCGKIDLKKFYDKKAGRIFFTGILYNHTDKEAIASDSYALIISTEHYQDFEEPEKIRRFIAGTEKIVTFVAHDGRVKNELQIPAYNSVLPDPSTAGEIYPDIKRLTEEVKKAKTLIKAKTITEAFYQIAPGIWVRQREAERIIMMPEGRYITKGKGHVIGFYSTSGAIKAVFMPVTKEENGEFVEYLEKAK